MFLPYLSLPCLHLFVPSSESGLDEGVPRDASRRIGRGKVTISSSGWDPDEEFHVLLNRCDGLDKRLETLYSMAS
jgi:hypothetical protein